MQFNSEPTKTKAFQKYNKASLLIYLLVLALVFAVAMVWFNYRLQQHKANVSESFWRKHSQLQKELKRSQAILSQLRGAAEETLISVSPSSVPIQTSPGLFVARGKGILQSQQSTISGVFPDNPDDLWRKELAMVKKLTPALAASLPMLPELTWIYYISNSGFVSTYPGLDPKVWRFNPDILESEAFQKGLPENNPQRTLYATSPEVDLVGSGLLTSFAAPVYSENTFLGVLTLDFKVQHLSELLMTESGELSNYVLVHRDGWVVAHAGDQVIEIKDKQKYYQVLPQKLRAYELLGKATQEVNDYFINQAELEGVPWVLIQYTNNQDLRMQSAQYFLVFVLLLALVLAVVAITSYSLIRKTFVLPATQLIDHISANAKGLLPSQLPPEGWESWFDIVSKAFSDNQTLLNDLQYKNDQLDDLVAHKTRELVTANHTRQLELERMSAMLDAIPDPIAYKNADGEYLGCNQAFERLAGMNRDSIIGKTDKLLFSPSLAQSFSALADRVWEHRKTHREIINASFIAGGSRLLDTIATPLFDEDGSMVAMISIGRDITEQQQALTALKESESRFRAAMEYAAIGMCLVSLDGRFFRVNQAFCDMLGYEETELLRRRILDITHPLDAPRDKDNMSRLESGELPYFQYEKRHLNKRGAVVWGMLSMSLVRDSNHRPLYFIAQVQDTTQRKQDEQQLQQLALVAQETDNAILITNAKGYVEWVNEGFTRHTGYTLQDIGGREPGELLFGEQTEPDVIHLIESALKYRHSQQCELVVYNRLKQAVWFDWHIQPVFGDAGLEQFIVIASDISERKRTEAKLKQSEQRLQLVMNAVEDGLWDWYVDLDSLYTNDRFWNMLGYQADDMDNALTTWKNLIHPEDAEPVWQELQSHIRKGSSSYLREYRMRCKNGEYAWIRARGKIVERRHSGEAHRMVGVITNINQQKQAELALQGSEQRFRTLVSNMPAAVYRASMESGFNLVYLSDPIFEITGYTPQQLLSNSPSLLHIIHPEDLRKVTQRRLLTGEQQDTWHAEFRLLHKSGELRWLETGGRVNYDADNQGWLDGVMSDVTIRKQAEQALHTAKLQAEKASLAKSEFLANVSHEIRTPMNGILGMLQLVKSSNMNAQQSEYLTQAESSASSLLQIINDILDFSKIEAGKLSMERLEFALDETIEQAIAQNAIACKEKGLKFWLDIDPAVPGTFVGDPLRITQVLTNLLNNAVKFTHSGDIKLKCWLISSSETNQRIGFSVADTGIGIAKSDQTRLFEMFHQADGSTTRKFGGTGLGLSICKQLVNIMGGDIKVDSELGQGAEFIFDVQLDTGYTEKRQKSAASVYFWSDGTDYAKHLTRQVNGASRIVDFTPGADKLVKDDILLVDWSVLEQAKVYLEHDQNRCTLVVSAPFGHSIPETIQTDHRYLGVLATPFTRNQWERLIERMPTVKPEPIQVPQLSDYKLLLVEDNEINQMVAKQMLIQTGIALTFANNGREALEYLQDADFDLVLMDIQMPVMDGLSAVRAIRKQGKTLPVVAMTAQASEEDKSNSREAGMDAHLTKPINQAALYAVLSEKLSAKQSGKEISSLVSRPTEIIDWEFGIGQFGGNEEVYFTCLSKFFAQFADIPQDLDRQLDANNWSELEFQIHNLKGVSGNLGLVGLSLCAKALHSAIKSNKEDVGKEALELIHCWKQSKHEVEQHIYH